MLTNFSGSQSNFRGLFDNAQPELEILRPGFDITHTFNGNWVWEIPLGAGRRWMNSGSILDTIAGGWDLSGFFRMRSGEVVNIISQRGTINRGGSRALTNTVHLEGIDIKALQTKTGAHRHPDGRVTLFDSSLISEGGFGNPNVFKNPALLQAGSLAMSPVSGPWFTTLDVGLRKSVALPFTEESRLQLRVDAFNVLNHTNFSVTSTSGLTGLGVVNMHNPNTTDFGLISSAFSARTLQVGLKVEF